jgi:hypothetical protein
LNGRGRLGRDEMEEEIEVEVRVGRSKEVKGTNGQRRQRKHGNGIATKDE